MSSEIKCIHDHDDFCFVCGDYIFYMKNKGETPKKRYIEAPKFVEGYQNMFNRSPLERIVNEEESDSDTDLEAELEADYQAELEEHSETSSENEMQAQVSQLDESLELGHNVLKKSLVAKDAIIFPPLHIMLGLMSQFIKTLVKLDGKEEEETGGKPAEKTGGKQGKKQGKKLGKKHEKIQGQNKKHKSIRRLHKLFPKLLADKINGGVFNGPAVRRILDDEIFFRTTATFAVNLGAYSDQHGERFHQDIKVMENRYKGKDYRHMLGDHCWHLIHRLRRT